MTQFVFSVVACVDLAERICTPLALLSILTLMFRVWFKSCFRSNARKSRALHTHWSLRMRCNVLVAILSGVQILPVCLFSYTAGLRLR